MPDPVVELTAIGSEAAGHTLDELSELYREVYGEAPYCWGEEHVELFRTRFMQQCQAVGFRLVIARSATQLVGFTFGVTLLPTTPWWHNLTTDVEPSITEEYDGRTFAVVELVVQATWRRRGIARRLHDELLTDRAEERATLTVLPEVLPAQRAYAAWGWQRVAQKRNPLPGSPVFDVMVKGL